MKKEGELEQKKRRVPHKAKMGFETATSSSIGITQSAAAASQG